MEVLFHLIFEIVKIAILACIYSTLLLIAYRMISHSTFSTSNNKSFGHGFRFWLVIAFIISLGFFFFMFTYYGDHGLGDSSRIPIGYFKDVKQIDGYQTYIENQQGKQLDIQKFTVNNNKLYAQLTNDNTGKYFYAIWNLKTDKWTLYRTEKDYLLAQNVPLPGTFKDFDKHYTQYWNGWRFWLLP
ncbi:MAG: hypothetical protein H0X33_10755 [Taibaiella sp.]|nr:hypothetical protein [Taibaiella sp.]